MGTTNNKAKNTCKLSLNHLIICWPWDVSFSAIVIMKVRKVIRSIVVTLSYHGHDVQDSPTCPQEGHNTQSQWYGHLFFTQTDRWTGEYFSFNFSMEKTCHYWAIFFQKHLLFSWLCCVLSQCTESHKSWTTRWNGKKKGYCHINSLYKYRLLVAVVLPWY